MSVRFRPRVGQLVWVPSRGQHGWFFWIMVLSIYFGLVVPIKLTIVGFFWLFWALPRYIWYRAHMRAVHGV